MSDLNKKESKSLHSITNQEYIQERISKSNLNMQSQSLKSMKSIIEVEHEERNKILIESNKEIEIIENNNINNNVEKKVIFDNNESESKISKDSLKEKTSLTSSNSKTGLIINNLNNNIKPANLGNNIEIVEKKPPVVEIKNPVITGHVNRVVSI